MELIKLNELSKTKTFVVPPHNELKASKTEPWTPLSLTHGAYLPSYQQLRPEVQLRYNQLNALYTTELFIWFELKLLLPILKKLIASNTNDPVFQEACQIFYNDEVRHSELFRRLNQQSAPEFYMNADFYFIRSYGRIWKYLFEITLRFPLLLSSWCWILIFLEERTLMASKEYMKHKDSVSAEFARAHILHMIDEVRHVEMDEYFVDKLYANASKFSKWSASHLVKIFLKSFKNPSYSPLAIAKQLKAEFPLAADHQAIDQLMSELPLLKGHHKYQVQFFGLEASRGTQKLLKKYPEMAEVKALFLEEK